MPRFACSRDHGYHGARVGGHRRGRRRRARPPLPLLRVEGRRPADDLPSRTGGAHRALPRRRGGGRAGCRRSSRESRRSCSGPGATIPPSSRSWCARSPAASSSRARSEEVGEAFAIVQRIIEEGQATGVVPARHRRAARELGRVRRARGGAHRLGARQLPDGEDEVARAERTAIDLALGGLCA